MNMGFGYRVFIGVLLFSGTMPVFASTSEDVSAILALVDFFEPTALYAQLQDITLFYLKWMAIVVFGIAVMLRYIETSIDTVGGEGSWSKAFMDTLSAAVGVALYVGVGLSILTLHSAMVALISSHGSFEVIAGEYGRFIAKVDKVAATGDWMDDAVRFFNMHSSLIAWLLFIVSFIFTVFVYIFLRLAYAFMFCLVYVWGLVGLSSAPSRTISMKSGWVKSAMGVLIWPIIEATIFWMFLPMFQSMSEMLVPENNPQMTSLSEASLYVLFFFTNFIMMAILVASAAIAYFLAMNQSAVMGMFAPFAMAGLGAAQMFTKYTGRSLTPFAHAGVSVATGTGGAVASLASKPLGMAWDSIKGDGGHSTISPAVGDQIIGGSGGANAGPAATVSDSAPPSGGPGGGSNSPSSPVASPSATPAGFGSGIPDNN